MRGEHEACLQALEHSRDNGSLPDATEIIVDPDMSNVYNQTWFVDFIDGLNKSEVVVEPEIVIVEAEANKAE